MTEDRSNLVLGLCTNYALHQIEPFLATLRTQVGDAHVCLFAAGMDLAFYHAAEDLGIEVCNALPYLKHGFRPEMARYMMYDDYLSAFAQRFRKILLTDLRDVVFQGDPFAEPLYAEVSFAAEDHKIGSCPNNSTWLRMLYGEAVLAELADCQISCSGTTIGEAGGIVCYVKTMREEIETRTFDRRRFGLDQGIHNYIVWKLRPPYGRFDPANRIVQTLHYTPKHRLQVTEGQITFEGRAAPIVHQFDRHPDLVAHIARAAPFRLAKTFGEKESSNTELVARLQQLEDFIAVKDTQINRITARCVEAERRTAAIETATFWRATYPLRRMMAGWPPGLRRIARAGSKLAWWSLTLRLSRKLCQRRSLLRAHAACVPPPRMIVSIKKAIKIGFLYYLLRLIGNATYPILGGRAPLRGYYDKTRDLMKYGEGGYIELEPPSGAHDSTPLDALRPAIFVARIPRGRSLYNCGVIASPDHRLLADVSANRRWTDLVLGESQPLYHPAMYKLRLPPIRHIAGSVAVISSVQPNNYYHWMFDILPRFEILRKSKLVPDYYLINMDTSFQKESLMLLDIPLNRILSPTMDTNIEANELIVPSLPGPVFDASPQAQSCKFLRSAFLQDRTRTPYRLLYITRTDANTRRIINEAEILKEVLGYGFQVVSLTGVPFLQQVKLFSEARIVVGPHGAGFANAVFCPSGSVLIEFMPERRQIDCFARLAHFVGMEYHSILGIENDVPDAPDVPRDHEVDTAELRKLLRQFTRASAT